MTIPYVFSDAFDLQYGVCVLRMKEGLDISRTMQAHGMEYFKTNFLKMFYSLRAIHFSFLKSPFTVVNLGFETSTEQALDTRTSTTTTSPTIDTSCVYPSSLILNLFMAVDLFAKTFVYPVLQWTLRN